MRLIESFASVFGALGEDDVSDHAADGHSYDAEDEDNEELPSSQTRRRVAATRVVNVVYNTSQRNAGIINTDNLCRHYHYKFENLKS